MVLNVQSTPPTPSFKADNINVPANIATPQAAIESVKAGQHELNAVNNFSGGRRRTLRRRNMIRTYKGRKYHETQKGGSTVEGGQIPIPQVGSTCNTGINCGGAQNAIFTSINNQAQSNGINDAYLQKAGRGRGRGRGSRDGHKKVRFSKHRTFSRKNRHDQSLTTIIAYNIKKVMRKVFS